MTAPTKPGSKLTNADYTALATMAKARKDNLNVMFGNARIVYGKHAAKQTAGDLKDAAKEGWDSAAELFGFAKGSGLGKAAEYQVKQIVIEAVGVENWGEFSGVVGEIVASELVKQMTPWVGLIYSGGKAAKAWKAVVEEARHLLRFDDYKKDILPGDPKLACDAVRIILQRNMAQDTVTASVETANFAVKIAGMCGDFGTGATTAAVGFAGALASLALTLTQLGIDIREMRAGNRYLKAPGSIDKRIFSECPLVGAYFIAYSPASMVLNFMIADIGLPGWMDQVETFKSRSLDPLVDIATEQIGRSRITITGFNTGKGHVEEKSFKEKLQALNYKNVKFQFNRLVRSKIPF